MTCVDELQCDVPSGETKQSKMKKYKHRLVIEVTFSEQITEIDAALCLRMKLDSFDVFVDPVYKVVKPNFYITNYVVKAFSKVAQSLSRHNLKMFQPPR